MSEAKSNQEEVRWKQRFQHYCAALEGLERAAELARTRPLSELEEQGVIQGFEFTHELAWKTMKDFFQSRGTSKLFGSKDATREAFQAGLIQDGEVWMQMILHRNLTSHAYDRSSAQEILQAVLEVYMPRFSKFRATMKELAEEDSK